MFRSLAFLTIVALSGSTSRAGTIIELLDGPALTIQPGDVGGWGLSVTSDEFWVIFTGSTFSPLTSLGTYTDYLSGPNFFFGTLGGTTESDFDPTNLTGVGQFAVSPATLLGSSVAGSLQVFWDGYSLSPEDPLFDPGIDLISPGNITTFDVSVSAGSTPVPVATPEPRSLWLVLGGAALLAWRNPRFRMLFVVCVFVGISAEARAQTDAYQKIPQDISSNEKKVLSIIRNLGLPGIGPNCRANSDTLNDLGCCGSPGHFGCSSVSDSGRTASFCTDPGSNNLRVDSFSSGDLAGFDFAGDIICDLPKGTCDTGLAESINGTTKTGPQDYTFYSTSDLHFFRGEWWVENQVRHVTVINGLAGNLFPWPGWPSERIGPPLGVVIAGDTTLNAGRSELASFRLLWERNRVGASIAYPVFMGLGNHDITGINGGKNFPAQIIQDPKRMLYYLYDRMNCGGVRMDPKVNGVPASGNYSWDYGRVHLVNLNTWPGDQTNKFFHASDGLAWLKQDLAANVGNTGLPVVIFEHYPWSSIVSEGVGTTADVSNYWDIVKDYNVIGFFDGHTHAPSILRVEDDIGTIQRDSGGKVKLLDEFRSGTGGERGRGDLLAVRYTEDAAHINAFMDVATVAWENVNGIQIAGPENLESLEPNVAMGTGYYGAEGGCHKRVNTRFNDVSSFVTLSEVIGVNNNSAIVTIRRTPSSPLFPDSSGGPNPIQFALALNNLSSAAQFLTPNFVNSCSIAKMSGAVPNVRYVQLTDQQVLDLNAGHPITVVLGFVSDPGSYDVGLTALSPLKGTRPFSLDLNIGINGIPPAKLVDPPAQTFISYGEPGALVSLTVEYTQPEIFGSPWITVPSSPLVVYDKFGQATSTFGFAIRNLVLAAGGSPSATLHINPTPGRLPGDTSPDLLETGTFRVALHYKVATTMTVTSVNPPQNYNPLIGLPMVVKATLGHGPAMIDGGNAPVDGIASLSDAVLDSSGKVVSTTPLTSVVINDPSPCTDRYNIEASLKPGPDSVVFGDAGNTGFGANIVPGYCPSFRPGFSRTPFHTTTDLALGLHHFVVEYAGNDSFNAVISQPFDYLVARGLDNMKAVSGASQATLVGTTFTQPLAVKVFDVDLAGAPGIPVTFTAPASVATGFFPGVVPAVTVRTGSDGIATAPPFAANFNAGTYQVAVTVGTLPVLNLSLTNTALNAGPPVLVAAFGTKSGALGARQWPFRIVNTGGPAANVQISSLTVTPPAGSTCVPKLVTALPLTIGDVGAGATVTTGPITLDLSAPCTNVTRLTVTIGIAAQGYSTSTTLGNQFP